MIRFIKFLIYVFVFTIIYLIIALIVGMAIFEVYFWFLLGASPVLILLSSYTIQDFKDEASGIGEKLSNMNPLKLMVIIFFLLLAVVLIVLIVMTDYTCSAFL